MMVMALGETCWITKKGITRWFHKKNMFLRTQYITADYAIVRSYMGLYNILFVKPSSDTLLRYSTCFTKRHHHHLYNLLKTDAGVVNIVHDTITEKTWLRFTQKT
jgi:hypothetical protein